MARAYLTDRQMPRSYWFYDAIRHAAQMMNHAPGCLKSQLTTPSTNYKLDPGRHTPNLFGLTYDGGIFVGLYSNNSSPVAEPYPPGTRLLFRRPDSQPQK
eukprot:scaffold40960_cov50-Attheya_sp.AAC.2